MCEGNESLTSVPVAKTALWFSFPTTTRCDPLHPPSTLRAPGRPGPGSGTVPQGAPRPLQHRPHQDRPRPPAGAPLPPLSIFASGGPLKQKATPPTARNTNSLNRRPRSVTSLPTTGLRGREESTRVFRPAISLLGRRRPAPPPIREVGKVFWLATAKQQNRLLFDNPCKNCP